MKRRGKKKKPARTSANSPLVDSILLSLVENLDVFVGICSPDFMPLYCNRGGMKMVGLDSLEEALQKPIPEWYFPEDRDFMWNVFFPKVLEKGQNETEIRFRNFKTGEAVWMLCSVFATRDARGKVQSYATISHNITQRKAMEAQMHLDGKLLQAAYRASGMVPWEFDPGLECFFLSVEAALLLGFERGNTRLPLHRLLAQVDRPEDAALVRNAFSRKRPEKTVALNFNVRLKDETVRSISCQGRLFFDRGQNAMLGVFADVKERQNDGDRLILHQSKSTSAP